MLKEGAILELQRRNEATMAQIGAALREMTGLLAKFSDQVGGGSDLLDLLEQKSTTVQTLILSKNTFKSAAEAKAWARKHEFDAGKVDETEDSYRIRQKDPGGFHDATFRTIDLTTGVKAVIGKMKEAMTEERAPFWVQGMPEEAKAAWLEAFNASWDKHDDLEDEPRKYQATFEADAAVRKKGWVMVHGSWMREGRRMSEAAWDTAYINDLPDSAFAVVEPGGEKDAEGKTTPRSKRHLPYRNKNGEVDLPHLRNALSRLPQTDLSSELKAKAERVLKAAAKQAGIEVAEGGGMKKGAGADLDFYVSLQEEKFDAGSGTVTAVLIEAGTNTAKRRHYPKAVVEAAAPQFAGLKMFINHPTAEEEAKRPERDLRDWASTITESYAEDGKAIGKIAVHDKWLKELLSDPIARKNVGLSINARGQVSTGVINGEQMTIVEKIIVEKGPGRVSSVDWVTEPGARGRVVEVFESRRGDLDMLESITLKDLKENRPDLIQDHEAEVKAKIEREGTVLTEADRAKLMEDAKAEGKKAAEARFNELVEACLKEGPQLITRHGAEAAVLVPADQWRQLARATRPTLKDLLLADAPRTDALVPQRSRRHRRPSTG